MDHGVNAGSCGVVTYFLAKTKAEFCDNLKERLNVRHMW